MRDWDNCRRLYIEEGKSLREIAQCEQCGYEALRKRAWREKWRAARDAHSAADGEASIDRVAQKLLERIEGKLQEEGALEVKDFKTVSGALKELSELRTGREKGKTESGALTVRFVGETEEMSR